MSANDWQPNFKVIHLHNSGTDWIEESPAYHVQSGAKRKVALIDPRGLIILCWPDETPPDDVLDSIHHLWRINQ